MCIAYLAIGRHPEWPLFIAANRDEFHARPSLAAAPWSDHPHIISGLDLAAGGTWLGISHQGHYAFLTNFRDPAAFQSGTPSRGQLVGDYLAGHDTPKDYALAVSRRAGSYNGFNLIVGNLTDAWYVGNRTPAAQPHSLRTGSYTLSNHLLDTPWPKTMRLRQALDHFPLEQLNQSVQPVFDLLKDTTQAGDAELPSTGITPDKERLLSSPFIISPDYGTRCSTVVAIHASGRGFLAEISFDAQGSVIQRHDWPFNLQS